MAASANVDDILVIDSTLSIPPGFTHGLQLAIPQSAPKSVEPYQQQPQQYEQQPAMLFQSKQLQQPQQQKFLQQKRQPPQQYQQQRQQTLQFQQKRQQPPFQQQRPPQKPQQVPPQRPQKLQQQQKSPQLRKQSQQLQLQSQQAQEHSLEVQLHSPQTENLLVQQQKPQQLQQQQKKQQQSSITRKGTSFYSWVRKKLWCIRGNSPMELNLDKTAEGCLKDGSGKTQTGEGSLAVHVDLKKSVHNPNDRTGRLSAVGKSGNNLNIQSETSETEEAKAKLRDRQVTFSDTVRTHIKTKYVTAEEYKQIRGMNAAATGRIMFQIVKKCNGDDHPKDKVNAFARGTTGCKRRKPI